MPVGLTNHF